MKGDDLQPIIDAGNDLASALVNLQKLHEDLATIVAQMCRIVQDANDERMRLLREALKRAAEPICKAE